MVRLENLTFAYPGAAPILRQVDLYLSPGSFHFLTGTSGAGKTSLLQLIAMELRAGEGQLSVLDQDVAVLDREARAHLRRKIGFVFQDFRLLPHMTIRENVALPLKVAGTFNRQESGHVKELLAWVGLADVAHRRPAELSGGEQQRAAIARAVITRPTLLLADEPTGNVDDAMAQRLLHLFMELHRGGTTVLIATHNATLARSCDRPVLYLAKGQVTHMAEQMEPAA